MALHRMERVNELLKREIGALLLRFAGEERFDAAAVTVTHVETSPNLREAQVHVSLRADEDVREDILRSLRKRRSDFQRHIARNMTLKYTPRLHFRQDDSLLKGHRVLNLLAELDEEQAAREATAGTETDAENEATP